MLPSRTGSFFTFKSGRAPARRNQPTRCGVWSAARQRFFAIWMEDCQPEITSGRPLPIRQSTRCTGLEAQERRKKAARLRRWRPPKDYEVELAMHTCSHIKYDQKTERGKAKSGSLFFAFRQRFAAL